MISSAIAPNPKYFQLHGEGFGGKIGNLIFRSEAVLAADLRIVQRVNGIGFSIVFDFLKRCGSLDAAGTGDFDGAQSAALGGKFSEAERKLIRQVCADLRNYPALMVRSSAGGEASGTGIYESCECLNSPDAVARALRIVMASYLSKSAALFRADAGLGEGMAISIEPMVAEVATVVEQYYKDEAARAGSRAEHCYAPRLSGFAHSSNLLKLGAEAETNLGPYAGLVKGLSKRYMTNPKTGIMVDKESLKSPSDDYEFDIIAEPGFEQLTIPMKNKPKSSFDKETLYLDEKGKIKKGKVLFSGLDEMFDRNVRFEEFFNRLERLEQLCKARQRVEFAMKHNEGEPAYYITQIADAPQSRFEFRADMDSPRLVGVSDSVLGNGEKSCEFLVCINEANGGSYPSGFSEKHVLLFNPGIKKIQDCAPGSYSEMRNAVALATISPEPHGDGGLSIISDHLGGILHLTDKLFMKFSKFDWKRLKTSAEKLHGRYEGIDIYKVPLRAIGSDYTRQGILEIRD
ncbi:MAG: hypothetical protein WC263_00480 [Candidatus Micrarchaeia archaeon]|jgi:hypothetical protein